MNRTPGSTTESRDLLLLSMSVSWPFKNPFEDIMCTMSSYCYLYDRMYSASPGYLLTD